MLQSMGSQRVLHGLVTEQQVFVDTSFVTVSSSKTCSC